MRKRDFKWSLCGKNRKKFFHPKYVSGHISRTVWDRELIFGHNGQRGVAQLPVYTTPFFFGVKRSTLNFELGRWVVYHVIEVNEYFGPVMVSRSKVEYFRRDLSLKMVTFQNLTGRISKSTWSFDLKFTPQEGACQIFCMTWSHRCSKIFVEIIKNNF